MRRPVRARGDARRSLPGVDSTFADLRALYAERDLGPDAHRAAYTALMSTTPAPEGLAGAVYERIRLPEGWVAYRDTHATIAVLVDAESPWAWLATSASISGLSSSPMAWTNSRFTRPCRLRWTPRSSPAPEIFRSALAGLAAAPARTLMVGDHPVADGGAAAVGDSDIDPARSARQGRGTASTE